MNNFKIVRYTPDKAGEWNQFVAKSKNGTFLFDRNYMDYHADRFRDHSLMFYNGRKLHSLLPAHVVDDTLFSHFGLTYGGLVMTFDTTIMDVVEIFSMLNAYLKENGIKKVVYRPVPWIYHRHPSEEDLYAIFWKNRARLLTRNIGTTIFMQQHEIWRKDHRRRLKQAKERGVTVVRDGSIAEFWHVLESNLRQRFNATPVHTLDEMLSLKSKFPDNIIQYNAYLDGEIIGGILFYVMPQVIHGHYSSTNEIGKQNGAMEAIYERVMYKDYAQMPYLDFGSSTEQQGSVINEGLIAHKEGYGGRAICYDTYEWEVNSE